MDTSKDDDAQAGRSITHNRIMLSEQPLFTSNLQSTPTAPLPGCKQDYYPLPTLDIMSRDTIFPIESCVSIDTASVCKLWDEQPLEKHWHTSVPTTNLDLKDKDENASTDSYERSKPFSRGGMVQGARDEFFYAPEMVQGFGALVALHEKDDGHFVVQYVSENSEDLLGYQPAQLFGLVSFLNIFSQEQQDNLLEHIRFIRDHVDRNVDDPEVFLVSIRHPKMRKSSKLWCRVFISAVAQTDLIICEFELRQPSETLAHAMSSDTPHLDQRRDDVEHKAEAIRKPLQILRSPRGRRTKADSMQVFSDMSRAQEQFATSLTQGHLLKTLVGKIKELSGFHRVMVHQFDSSFNAKVVAETVDRTQAKDAYMGLYFPAADYPSSGAKCHKSNMMTLLYDREQAAARIVCRTKGSTTMLDLTRTYLQTMSAFQLKRLSHMAVRSFMLIPINIFNRSWGLIVCHYYGSHGIRAPFQVRKMCCFLGETASRNIERLAYSSKLQAESLMNTSATPQNPVGHVIASSNDLLKLFDAELGLLSISGETRMLGTMQYSQEVLALLKYLLSRRYTSIVSSRNVCVDFKDLQNTPGFHGLAGLLYIPLSPGGSDFVCFFRISHEEEINWAGNPYEKHIGPSGDLEPRSNFKCWREIIIGKCRPWTDEQINNAATLGVVYGKQIVSQAALCK